MWMSTYGLLDKGRQYRETSQNDISPWINLLLCATTVTCRHPCRQYRQLWMWSDMGLIRRRSSVNSSKLWNDDLCLDETVVLSINTQSVYLYSLMRFVLVMILTYWGAAAPKLKRTRGTSKRWSLIFDDRGILVKTTDWELEVDWKLKWIQKWGRLIVRNGMVKNEYVVVCWFYLIYVWWNWTSMRRGWNGFCTTNNKDWSNEKRRRMRKARVEKSKVREKQELEKAWCGKSKRRESKCWKGKVRGRSKG